MKPDNENGMTKDELKVRRNEIVSDIAERSNIRFGDYILTSSEMNDLLDFRNRSTNAVIPFVYNKVVNYIDKGITIFIDGGGKEKKTIKGIDRREIIAVQMAYLLCVKLVDKNPLLDLNSVIKRIEFDSLVRNIFDYQTSDEVFNFLTKHDILLITNLNIKSVRTLCRSPRDSDKEDEVRLQRIALYFDDLFHKRLMMGRITIVTVFDNFDDVASDSNIYRFGSRIHEAFEVLKESPNIFEDELHFNLKFCRIHIPSPEDKRIDIKRFSVDDFKRMISRKNLHRSDIDKIVSLIQNTNKTSEYSGYDSNTVFGKLCSVVDRVEDKVRLNTLLDLCKKDPGLVIMFGGDRK